jgi:hypothetical protein
MQSPHVAAASRGRGCCKRGTEQGIGSRWRHPLGRPAPEQDTLQPEPNQKPPSVASPSQSSPDSAWRLTASWAISLVSLQLHYLGHLGCWIPERQRERASKQHTDIEPLRVLACRLDRGFRTRDAGVNTVVLGPSSHPRQSSQQRQRRQRLQCKSFTHSPCHVLSANNASKSTRAHQPLQLRRKPAPCRDLPEQIKGAVGLVVAMEHPCV